MAKPSFAVRWSPESEADLIEIWLYGAGEISPDGADKHLRELHAACMRLAEWPNSGRARIELAPGLRSIPVYPHIIFYRVMDAAIEVVRILHGQRDLEAVFDEPDKE